MLRDLIDLFQSAYQSATDWLVKLFVSTYRELTLLSFLDWSFSTWCVLAGVALFIWGLVKTYADELPGSQRGDDADDK